MRLTWPIVGVSACGGLVPDEPAPVVVDDLTLTVDGVELAYEARAVIWNGRDEIRGRDCEAVVRFRDGMAESVNASLDLVGWVDGAALLPGPDARPPEGGFLHTPSTGTVSGGVGSVGIDGTFAEFIWRQGSVWDGETATPFGEAVLSFDGEVPPGEWRNPNGVPGDLVAPSGVPWCTLPPWEAEGWERIF